MVSAAALASLAARSSAAAPSSPVGSRRLVAAVPNNVIGPGQNKYCESFGYTECARDLSPCTIGSTLLDDDEDACNWRGLCDDDGNCDCDEGAFGDRCEKDVANQNYLPLASRYGSWGIAAAGIAFAYFCIGWTCVNRKTKVLKAAQPSFLVVIAIGCICCISAIFPASFDHRGRTEVWIEDSFFVRGNRMGYPELDVACNTQVWIYCLGFTITFGALLTKLWRVMRIVNNTSVTLKKMPEWQLWSIAMTPFLVQLGIVLAWWQLAPLRWVVTTDVENDVGLLQQHGSCVISSDVSGEATASLGWLGHVSRMDFDRLPRRMLSSWMPHGRPIGCPNMTFGRSIRTALDKFHIDRSRWPELAADRSAWRQTLENRRPPNAFFAMPARARPPSPRIARTKPVRSCLARTNAAMDISLQALAGS